MIEGIIILSYAITVNLVMTLVPERISRNFGFESELNMFAYERE